MYSKENLCMLPMYSKEGKDIEFGQTTGIEYQITIFIKKEKNGFNDTFHIKSPEYWSHALFQMTNLHIDSLKGCLLLFFQRNTTLSESADLVACFFNTSKRDGEKDAFLFITDRRQSHNLIKIHWIYKFLKSSGTSSTQTHPPGNHPLPHMQYW